MTPMQLNNFDYSQHNKKIASLRGHNWREKLRLAKIREPKELTAIAIARHEKSMTQDQVMRQLGKGATTIYARIERGSVATKRDKAERIAQILGKNVSDLFIEFDKNRFIAI